MNKDRDVFICGICKASFTCNSFIRFMEHKMLHVDASKSVNCNICMKTFPKRNSLQRHLEHIHAIPQRLSSSSSPLDNNKSTKLASSSARCKPCSSSERDQSPAINKINSERCFPQTNKANLGSSDIPLQKHKVGTCANNIMFNSIEATDYNEYVDVLSIDDNPNVFSLNYCNDNCYNLISDGINVELVESDLDFAAISSSIAGKNRKESNILPTKANYESKDSSSIVKHLENSVEYVSNTLNNKDHLQNLGNGREENLKSKEAKIGEDLTTKSKSRQTDCDIDFHFLLGTTGITGNSLTYERVDFRCLHCSFSSAWRPSLVKHMKTAHRDVLVFHEILDIQNTSKSNSQSELCKKYTIMKFSDHTKMTLKNKTRKTKRITRSTEYQDIPGKYTCPICNKVFSRIRYIRRHQMTHKTQRIHLCDHCGKSFKTKSTLIAHTHTHNVKIYQCPQCDFVSNLTGAIHRHRQVHPNGSAVCDICGSVYIDKSTLKKHLRVHDPNRPFPCPEINCTWRFKSENLMKAHVKSHTVEGKFQCTYCGYRFRHKHHLQRHVTRIHHADSVMGNAAKLSLNPPSNNTAIVEASVSNLDNSSFIPESTHKHKLSLNFTNTHDGNLFESVLDSEVSLTAPTFGTQTIPCGQNSVMERMMESKVGQNMIHVLVNSNEQEIVINLPTNNHDMELTNNGTVDLDYNNTDVMQHVNLDQIFVVKDSQQQ